MRVRTIHLFAPVLLVACATPRSIESKVPEGWKVFHGSTVDHNEYNTGGISNTAFSLGSGQNPGNFFEVGGLGPSTSAANADLLSILVLPVQAQDKQHDALWGPADVHDAINSKIAEYHDAIDHYYREASYGAQDIQTTWAPDIYTLPRTFHEYFHEAFVATTLRTKFLTNTVTFADDEQVELHVRYAGSEAEGGSDFHLTFDFDGSFTPAELRDHLQTTFDGEIPGVVSVELDESGLSARLVFRLDENRTDAGTLIRFENRLKKIGADGPLETPGGVSGVVRLSGTKISKFDNPNAQFITNGETLEFEVRDADRISHTVEITLPQNKEYADAKELANTIAVRLNNNLPPKANGTNNWVKTDQYIGSADLNRIKLRLVTGGTWASLRVTGGSDLKKFGLNGPKRVDGRVSKDDANGMRDTYVDAVGSALGSFVKWYLDTSLIAIEAGNEAEIDAELDSLFQSFDFDAVWVYFVEDSTGIPFGKRSRANETQWIDYVIEGDDGYEYSDQRKLGFMIGPGDAPFQTWCHEIGHILGFEDLYELSAYDDAYDPDQDYVREWGIMDAHGPASHPMAWHKWTAGWAGNPQESLIPDPEVEVQTESFILAPQESPLEGYVEWLTKDEVPEDPITHLVRVKLSDTHWINVEARRPGEIFSQDLPDSDGRYPPGVGRPQGGVLVSDAYEQWADEGERAPLTLLNTAGIDRARGLAVGQSLNLGTAEVFPTYPGIAIDVVEKVSVKGEDDAFRVEIKRTGGDFVDLEIRPWLAPQNYRTRDIWIDWPWPIDPIPEDVEPAIGNIEPAHYDLPPGLFNLVMVRVRNLGTVEALGITVNCSVVLAGSGGAYQPLEHVVPGTTTEIDVPFVQNIPAGGSRDFAFAWAPQNAQGKHHCIRAELVVPEAITELSTMNNLAKENVGSYHTTAGSPYAPIPFEFVLGNPEPRPASYSLMPSFLPPGYHVALEDAHPHLGPEEVRTIDGLILVDEDVSADIKSARYFNLDAYRWTRDSLEPVGGITLNVFPTVKSSLELDLDDVFVRVSEKGIRHVVIPGRLTGVRRAYQNVDVALVDSEGTPHAVTVRTNNGGAFEAIFPAVPAGNTTIRADYFGNRMEPSSRGPAWFTIP